MNRLTWRAFRDAWLLLLGTVVAVNETLISPPPDLNALIFAAACLGVTAALRQDERKQ